MSRNTDRNRPKNAVRQATGLGVETLLYGLPQGETERYTEQLLATNRTEAQFEVIKRIASADGWHSFRIASCDLSKAPNFASTLNTQATNMATLSPKPT